MHGTGKVKSLIDVLIEESQTTIIWLEENGVIVNPPKFQIMFVSKTKKHHTLGFKNICTDDVNIKTQNSVKLLGISLDNNLNFESHIISICKFASVS